LSIPNLRVRNITAEDIGECEKESVAASAILPDVARASGYSANPKYGRLSFHYKYPQEEKLKE